MKRKGMELGLLAVIIAVMSAFLWSFTRQDYGYERYETGAVHYVKARTTEVLEQELTYSGSGGEYLTGYQRLTVEFLEGDRKGETQEIENYVTVEHHVIAREGQTLIICADEPDHAKPYYTVYNYSRGNGLLFLAAGFLLLVVLVGRRQGLMSCIGLLFTMSMVFCYLLPKLYKGNGGVGASAVTVAASCSVCCFCIGGLSRKTAFNIASSVVGGLSAGLFFWICTIVLRINGCTMDEAEALVLIAQSTGLKLEGVLYAGVMVSSLGAVMDIAASIGASLQEIVSLNPERTGKELFRSGMNIGRDAIGTMTNTLILAFAGGALATLLILISYGVQFNQLLSSNFLALEAAQGLAGSAAIVLTVPISAFINAAGCSLLHKKQKIKTSGGKQP